MCFWLKTFLGNIGESKMMLSFLLTNQTSECLKYKYHYGTKYDMSSIFYNDGVLLGSIFMYNIYSITKDYKVKFNF